MPSNVGESMLNVSSHSPPLCVNVCNNEELRFLGNKSIQAVTRNRCRFEEVGKVYGEENGWHSKMCSMCVCNCVCGESDAWHDTAGGRAVPPSVWVVGCRGLDNGECQAMWIKAVGL